MLKRLGLKAKILLGLSVLLIVVVATNLAFTNGLMVGDKKAYIFESVLGQSEELRENLDGTVRNALFQVESVLRSTGSQAASDLLGKQDIVEAFRLSRAGEILRAERKPSFPLKAETFGGFVAQWLTEVPASREGVSVRKLARYDSLEITQATPEQVLTVLISMEGLLAKLQSDVVFSHEILDAAGATLWQSRAATSSPALALREGVSVATAREVEHAGERYLGAIAPLPGLGLTVVSYIPASKAYAAVSELGAKTVAFGLVLLGFALMLGVLFSNKLTQPIARLMEGATKIADGNFGHQVVVASRDELFVLADRFNFMSGKISDLLGEKEAIISELRVAKDKIEDYSKNLEKMVAERTRELKEANDFIQAMINSLDQGLFVIDRELTCSDIYTRACEQLFRVAPAGRSFVEVLGLDEASAERTRKWADIVFSEKIPFESAVMLGVKEKTFGAGSDDPEFSVLKLNYHPMRDDDGAITNLVVVATDRTEEARAIEESRRKERYVEMIFKIISSKRQFIDLVAECDDYVAGLDAVFDDEAPQLETAMMIYHSLTGGMGMYAVEAIVAESRACEQSIVDMKKAGAVDLPRLRLEAAAFQEKYRSFKQEIFGQLGFNTYMVEVDQSIILYLFELIEKNPDRELRHVFTEKIMKVAVEDFFIPYRHLLVSLAPKLGKEYAPLAVNDHGLRVEPDRFKEFFSLLVHLFRNCADHGIEAPSVREERGKPIEGQISVECRLVDEGHRLELVVADDGGGIDPDRIREKLLLKPETSALAQTESDEEIIYHIFDQDFSTAEQVTAISGRGVGMSAIKDVVDRLGGTLKLDSTVGVGTRFIFELPLSS